MRFMRFTGFVVLLAAVAADSAPPVTQSAGGRWVQISDELLAKLEAAGQKPAWPGKTAGVTADPVSGDVYLVVPGRGVFKSSDHGKTFARSGGEPGPTDTSPGGRCETGAALQFDPAGKRLACFSLDGPAGMTLDEGKTWERFADVGRNWDYGAVDWSAEKPEVIVAMRHESGGELYLSTDAGKHWKMVSKDAKYNAVGVVGPKTLLAAKTGGGVFRSTDGGANWDKAADFTVTSHVAAAYKGAVYLVAKEGLIASTDGGATWSKRGEPVEATFGPIFKDEKNLVVWGKSGVRESADGGATWKLVAPLPEEYQKWSPEWMSNVGWDAKADTFYTSRMSMSAYRWER